MKYNLEKMMKHIGSFGAKIQSQSKIVQEQTQFISSETDIKLFVNENRSNKELPIEVNLEALNLNEDFEQHQSLILANALQVQEEELKAKMEQEEVDLPHTERVRRLLFNLVIESLTLSSDELSYILT